MSWLNISSICNNLRNVDALCKAQRLVELILKSCHKLENVNSLAKAPSLESINLACNYQLVDANVEELLTVPRLKVTDCHTLSHEFKQRVESCNGLRTQPHHM